jgi:2-polyprenyl-3-methyl-5-hydroxy-6-metoxy-1,4-benzoquinol methylase
MSQNSIIELYTDLATNPEKDFGWEKGLQNAMNHNYKKEWIDAIPNEIWEYCAAVGNPFEAGNIIEGMNVLDIGCGAGVDLCVASILVGEKGTVTGVDVTPAMVDKGRLHATLEK